MESRESIYLKIEAGDFEFLESSNQYELEQIKTNISKKLILNETELKEIIMNNSEIIIDLFNNAKNLKEDLLKSKKNLELLDCQISIIKKKYLDSFEKFENIIENKKNIDKTIEIFDKIKVFKSEIKLFKLQIGSQDPSVVEGQTIFSAMLKIKQILKQNEQIFKEIDYIKNDLDYFLTNQKTILANFETRLAEAILKKEKDQILKYLEYFSSLGLLVEQIHSFTNSFLTEIIAKSYLAKVKKITDIFKNQQNENNYIKPESVIDAREEFKNSLDEIGKMKDCMQNFCKILCTEFDKNNLVLYDQILENQGFKNLYNLFTDRIRKLILSALSKIQKFPDTFAYFQKDYLVLHFIMKEFCMNNSIDFIIIPHIKDAFIEQFKSSIYDNFTLGINLILNAEKTFSSSVSNNLVKSHLIEYMVSYLFQLNNIFIELEIEFSLKKENNVLEDDLVITLVEIVTSLFNETYLKKLLSIIDSLFTNSSQSNTSKNQAVVTQNYDFNLKKFDFYMYILIKLLQTLEEIEDKNDRLLGRKLGFSIINVSILNSIRDCIDIYFRNYFSKFLSKISNEVRVIFLEKEINEFKSFLEKVSTIQIEYLSCFDDDYTNNRFYEGFTIKFVFFNYFYLMFILLLSINKQNEGEQNLAFFDGFLENFNKNFKLKEVLFISNIQRYIKNSFYLSQEQIINQNIQNSNQIFAFIFFVRYLFYEKKNLFSFLKKQKLNIEFFAKSITLVFLKSLDLNLNQYVLFENNSVSSYEEILKYLSDVSISNNFNINLLKIS